MVMIFEPNFVEKQKSNYAENQLESYKTTNLILALSERGQESSKN